jgi:outer membrane protein OmpA-like peptidoglycan-associated protein
MIRRTQSPIAGGVFLSVFLFTVFATPAEEEETPVPFFPVPAVITEKVVSELRMYRNGRYAEQIRRTEHGRITVTPNAAIGRYYILEDVIRDARKHGARVDDSEAVDLPASALPKEWALETDPYPRLRPLPVLPSPVPPAGTVWKEKVTVSLFPEGPEKAHILPVTARYRYDGLGTFYGKQVHTVSGYISFDTDCCSGNYILSIAFNTDNGYPLFIKNTVEEAFLFSGGEKLSYKGFINHWYSYPEGKRPSDINVADVEIVETGEGPALRLKALRFRPDSAVLLPGEEKRLDAAAAAVREAGDGTILIAGHTADVGNPAGQQKLSTDRAKTIVGELIDRGVDPRRLLYEGRGATEPIGDNGSEEGRTQNRRVEIIFIED